MIFFLLIHFFFFLHFTAAEASWSLIVVTTVSLGRLPAVYSVFNLNLHGNYIVVTSFVPLTLHTKAWLLHAVPTEGSAVPEYVRRIRHLTARSLAKGLIRSCDS